MDDVLSCVSAEFEQDDGRLAYVQSTEDKQFQQLIELTSIHTTYTVRHVDWRTCYSQHSFAVQRVDSGNTYGTECIVMNRPPM